jgi:hypothetical protein
VNAGAILILGSVIIFAFAAAGVSVGGLALVPLGLAFFAAGHLV